MTDQDIVIRRARDLERFYRRTAERRAQGLCLKCGKRPPAPGLSQCEPCAEKKRAPDRARHHRRTAERIAQGLCPKCGKQPPAPEFSVCAPCAEKKRLAGRARDARLRAAGKPRRDREKARVSDRRRRRRQAAERRARGLCPNCGKQPPVPDASLCAPCGDHGRAAERARYAKGKAAGKLYGGRDPGPRRKMAREKSQRRLRERLEAGLCTRCGDRPPAEGGTTCEPCRESRQAAERRRYAERRAAGLCTRCEAPTFDGDARCGPCAVLENSRRSPEQKNYPPYCTSLFSATASPGIACRFESSRLDCFVGAGSGISNSQWPLSEQARPRRSPTLHHLWTVSIETPSCSAASRAVNRVLST